MAESGAGLKNGTLVWTPNGFTQIERLQIGDRVIGGDGTACTVLGILRKRPMRMLRLTFDRGVHVECGTEQTWRVLHPAARFPTRHSHGKVEPNPRYDTWEVVTAGAMLAMSGAAPLPRRRFLIPASGSIRMTAKPVPIDPYLLGVILGDGCLRNGVRISTADQEIVDAVAALLPPDLSMRQTSNYDYSLVLPGGKGHGRGGRAVDGHPLTQILRQYGLHGLLSGEKFVPDIYLHNSAKVRLALLQGLMDTDGSVANTYGTIEFSSTSPHLTAAVELLVASFGGKTATEGRVTQYTDKYGARKDGAPSFRVRIRLPQVVPFRLTRKIARLVNPISTCNERVLWTIQELGRSASTVIAVDSGDNTFVLKHGIVAHGNAESEWSS